MALLSKVNIKRGLKSFDLKQLILLKQTFEIG